MGRPDAAATGSGLGAIRTDTGQRLLERGIAIVEHSGIKGMRWGVRRSRGPSGTVGGAHAHISSAHDAEKAKELGIRAKKSGLHTLSNQELQHLVTRQNLESQYKRLQGSSKLDAGSKVAKEILLNVGKQHLTKVVSEGISAAAQTFK